MIKDIYRILKNLESEDPWSAYNECAGAIRFLLTEHKRLGKEVEDLMKIDYWQDRYNIVAKQCYIFSARCNKLETLMKELIYADCLPNHFEEKIEEALAGEGNEG
jgi:hypothetical protein